MRSGVIARVEDAQLSGQRVLVTGASGFFGQHLCRELAGRGAEVEGVSRVDRSAAEVPRRWWRADLENHAEVERLFDKVRPSVVYHLAGEVNGAPQLELLLSTYHSLLTSTVNLLRMAALGQCGRLVLVGSLEEHNFGTDARPPMSPYAAAKTCAREYTLMCHELFGAPTVVLRTFMSYGPGQPEWKVIPSTIRCLLDGVPPRLSSGSRQLDWVYVQDVTEAFVAAAVAPAIEGMTLDVGTGQLASIREVIMTLVHLIDPEARPVFGVLADRPERPPRLAETGATKQWLGWEPRTTLMEGLKQTVAWHRHLSEGNPGAGAVGRCE